jgi:hypothetical protein
MSNIDNGRVILGGLLAGLVINIGEFLRDGVLMAERVAGMLTKLGLSEPSGGQLLLFTIVGFALGIVAVWLAWSSGFSSTSFRRSDTPRWTCSRATIS